MCATEVAVCTCFGDPHCLSFDGMWSHYQGLCSYTMAESDCSGDTGLPKFRVVNTNWDREYAGSGAFAWVKEVTVEVYGKVRGHCRSLWEGERSL